LATELSGNRSTGVAIVRISGPQSYAILKQLTRQNKDFKPRTSTVCSLYAVNCPNGHAFEADKRPEPIRKIDSNILAVYFPAPHSFTGEDVVELHTHGNAIVVQQLLQNIRKLDAILPIDVQSNRKGGSIRLAEAGEFTKKAFENGKLDLTQVEGLADLLSAETEHQHQQAIKQLDGRLSELYNSWRREMLECLAYFEAVIDFSEDEADIQESEIIKNVLPRLNMLINSIQSHLNDQRRGEMLRSGVQIAIVGAPNAGKSTLLNTLAQRDVAIVSPIAGTTRDVLEVSLNISGYPVVLADTAGLRDDTQDIVELEGVRRAKLKVQDSHIKLALMDAQKCEEYVNSFISSNLLCSSSSSSSSSSSLSASSSTSSMSSGSIPPHAASLSDAANTAPFASATASSSTYSSSSTSSSSSTHTSPLSIETILQENRKSFYDSATLELVDSNTIVVMTKADRVQQARVLDLNAKHQLQKQKTADIIYHSARSREYAAEQQTEHERLMRREAIEASRSVSNRPASADDIVLMKDLQLQAKRNTIDIANQEELYKKFKLLFPQAAAICLVSCKYQWNMPALLHQVETMVAKKVDFRSDSGPLITRARHRADLNDCLEHLNLFRLQRKASGRDDGTALGMSNHHRGAEPQHEHLSDEIGQGKSYDLVIASEHLRLASRCLGRLVGHIDVEELLDVIFNDFCVGK
jgi:tRNA modification GTPase TrmE